MSVIHAIVSEIVRFFFFLSDLMVSDPLHRALQLISGAW